MPTYTYEIIPSDKSQEPECFEHYQSIHAEPLARHPETGEPVRRVITGGVFFTRKRSLRSSACRGSGCCRKCGS